MLQLGNLIYMFERNGANGFLPRVLSTANSAFSGVDSGGLKKEPRRGRGTNIEDERTVWTDGDTSGNGGAGLDVRSSGIKFLDGRSVTT